MAPSRDFPTAVTVTNESPVSFPSAKRMRAESGIVKRRATLKRGLSWARTYNQLFSQDADVRELLSFIRMVDNRGYNFRIRHQMLPGSGKDPLGSGASGASLDSGESGSSVATSGWPVSTTDVVAAGDYIRINSFGAVREITSNADSDSNGNATIDINPPIASDEAPSSSQSITTTDVYIWADLANSPSLPDGHSNAFYINDLRLGLEEVPNA